MSVSCNCSCSPSCTCRKNNSSTSADTDSQTPQERLANARSRMNTHSELITSLKNKVFEIKEICPQTCCELNKLKELEHRIETEVKCMRKLTEDYLCEMQKQGQTEDIGEISLPTTLFEDTTPKYIRMKDNNALCGQTHPTQSCKSYNPEKDTIGVITRMANKEMNKVKKENKILLVALRNERKAKPRSRCMTKLCCDEERKRGMNSDGKCELKLQYELLLRDYNRKDLEVMELRDELNERMEIDLSNEQRCTEQEIDFYKVRAGDLMCERTELAVLVDEQINQIKQYNLKLLRSNDVIKILQRELIDGEMTRARIYEQIECHIEKIKGECSGDIKEFVHLPTLIGYKREEVEKAKKDVECLKETIAFNLEQLELAREAFSQLRPQTTNTLDLSRLIRETKHQRDMMKMKSRNLGKEVKRMKNKLDNIKEKTRILRSDTSYTISRIGMHSESNRKLLQEHLNSLESELAELNAAATIATVDKDQEIFKLNEKLNILSNNFDEAQSHIQMLKSQVAYLSTLNITTEQPNVRTMPHNLCSESEC